MHGITNTWTSCTPVQSHLLLLRSCTQGTHIFQSLVASCWQWVSATSRACLCTAPSDGTRRAQMHHDPIVHPQETVLWCNIHSLVVLWASQWFCSPPGHKTKQDFISPAALVLITYLEVKIDDVNGDDSFSGIVLQSTCEESLWEEETRDPKHLNVSEARQWYK